MALGYSSDTYWADDYWFNTFLWWVLGLSSTLSTIPHVKYVVGFEDRVLGIGQDVRKFVVPMEDRTDDVEQS